ncbi:MAG TPA: hypothetical protein VLG37_03615 [Candidatus Saccharimonadales bacterium]|nr:hypothetical protein [Candidatus Saccharimonadales bacterium]
MGFTKYSLLLAGGLLSLFAAAPTSTTYHLQSYGVGSGGTAGSSSTNYSLSGISGEQGSSQSTSTTYKAGTGLNATQQANVPLAPTVTNPASYYNKLHIVIDNGSNPTDAKFAIAISTDAFASNINYIQNDNTVGPVLGPEDYQTYASWGSGTGFDVIGLAPSTVYTVKVKATQGKFTESAYSATGSASTVSPSLTFDIDVSATDSETAPPYTTNFGNLLPATVTNSPQKVWVDFDTNGANGGTVFITSKNGGLKSTATTYTITSATADLAVVSEGFGGQNSSATQSSGGPLTAQSPYTGSSQNVGIIDTTLRQLYTSANPIVAGRGSIQLKAKAASTTPAANDYTETLTLIAAASF